MAHINIAEGKAAIGSAIMKGFVDRLDEINTLADNAKGFVWRLQTETGDATTIKTFDDPNMLVNMRV